MRTQSFTRDDPKMRAPALFDNVKHIMFQVALVPVLSHIHGRQEFGFHQDQHVIGNNISEFTWDGTDQFGDKLANGVYLYKVTAKLNGEDLEHRNSAGDSFFQDGYGKIYIMR